MTALELFVELIRGIIELAVQMATIMLDAFLALLQAL